MPRGHTINGLDELLQSSPPRCAPDTMFSHFQRRLITIYDSFQLLRVFGKKICTLYGNPVFASSQPARSFRGGRKWRFLSWRFLTSFCRLLLRRCASFFCIFLRPPAHFCDLVLAGTQKRLPYVPRGIKEFDGVETIPSVMLEFANFFVSTTHACRTCKRNVSWWQHIKDFQQTYHICLSSHPNVTRMDRKQQSCQRSRT